MDQVKLFFCKLYTVRLFENNFDVSYKILNTYYLMHEYANLINAQVYQAFTIY